MLPPCYRTLRDHDDKARGLTIVEINRLTSRLGLPARGGQGARSYG